MTLPDIEESMRPPKGTLSELYDAYFKTRFGFDPRRDIVWKEVVRWIQEKYIATDARVLDCGAGYCNFINNVVAKERHAVDVFTRFHEYAAPDKIAYKVRQVMDWLNGPEPKKLKSPVRIAARVHYDLLRVFPFAHDSGKVARLLMNMLLMRAGYEPAIIHSTERQRYYEALKGSAAIILHMVQEAEENGLASIEKLLEEHETNTRSFVS